MLELKKNMMQIILMEVLIFPLDKLRDNLFKTNKDKTIYLICFSALRSYIAARILTQKGYDCFHLAGGYRLFKSLNNDLKSY